jgi:hypothetical protein
MQLLQGRRWCATGRAEGGLSAWEQEAGTECAAVLPPLASSSGCGRRGARGAGRPAHPLTTSPGPGARPLSGGFALSAPPPLPPAGPQLAPPPQPPPLSSPSPPPSSSCSTLPSGSSSVLTVCAQRQPAQQPASARTSRAARAAARILQIRPREEAQRGCGRYRSLSLRVDWGGCSGPGSARLNTAAVRTNQRCCVCVEWRWVVVGG